MRSVGTAIVGCGSVAAFYCNAIPLHPVLRFMGVTDRNRSRSYAYSTYYSVPKYDSLEDVLKDRNVELVVNLTNPRSHFAVSKACLDAGKNVYSEKPLAMSFSEAQQLVELARQKGLYIASGPSRVLAETAQTMWKALRENAIGQVHAVYAEMDGGLVYRMRYKEWVNEVGMHWPYKDEFEVGCTIEHAGYPISWLSAFFGPVDTVTAFATCQVPNLQSDIGLEVMPPDLTVACLKFKSGVVARLTSSLIAPPDRSIRIFGDTGVLNTDDISAPKCPVYIICNRMFRLGLKTISIPWRRKYPLSAPTDRALWQQVREIVRSPRAIRRAVRVRILHLRKRMDFGLGPAELASALNEGRPCRLSPEYCLHNTEVVLAIHNSFENNERHKITTCFAPMEPLPWALSKSSSS